MPSSSLALTAAQLDAFITDGFVRLDNAFSADLATACCDILWRDAKIDPADPQTWTRPVIRLGGYSQPPFRGAANTPTLTAAYDQLVGPGRWLPPGGLGTFPIRLPSPDDPGDAGWHIDASFAGSNPADMFDYRVNIASRGRALLMLFLFTEIGPDDAPTRIRVGSHLPFARKLAPHGAAGLSLRNLIDEGYGWEAGLPETVATGRPGTVYLCHPFLIHSAQAHRGTRPRIIAQPPLLPSGELDPTGGTSPVEAAIRAALEA
jgi:hypothetical protein